MRRLNTVENAFVAGESTAPQHTLKIAILAPDDYSFAAAKQAFADRLHLAPPLRWMPAKTPFGLNRAVWRTGVEIDLDHHIRHIGVPAPGGMRELCDVVAELSGRPIDPAAPMWELWLLEGLEGGRVAALMKLHHSLADGIAAKHMLERLFSTEPGAPIPPAAVEAETELPGKVGLLWAGLKDAFREVRHHVPELRSIAKRGRSLKDEIGEDRLPPAAYSGPRLPFNGVLHRERRFAVSSTDLAEVKAAGQTFDATINDVFLSVAAGALRSLLADLGELPDEPIVASVPITVREPDDTTSYGNKISKMYAALRTDIEDPIERLEAQREAARQSKAEFEATRGARLEDWLDVYPAFVTSAIFRLAPPLVRAGSPPSENVVLSNVPGPRQKLYLGDTPVEDWYSTGQVFHGLGLNITCWSYVDRLNTCVFAGRDAIPDEWDLVRRIENEFVLVVKRAQEHTTS